MTPFVSALELATYFDGTTELGDLSPEWIAQAELLLEMISADVEVAAGVPIEAGSTTLVVAGSWSRDLLLPPVAVRNITLVSVNAVTLDVAEYEYNDRGLLRRGSADLISDVDFDASEDWSSLGRQGATWRAGRHWGGPASTVRVEAETGLVDVPDFVLRIAARTIGNVSDVTQESLAVYSVTYGRTRSDSGLHVSDGERKRLRRVLNRTGGTIDVGGR